jgi:hypothetical protein
MAWNAAADISAQKSASGIKSLRRRKNPCMRAKQTGETDTLPEARGSAYLTGSPAGFSIGSCRKTVLSQRRSVNTATDVRARCHLAWDQREKNCAAALQMIAATLALDKMGQYRERLLAKQQVVMAQQVRRHQTEYLLLVNLVSKYPAPDQTQRPKDDGAVSLQAGG